MQITPAAALAYFAHPTQRKGAMFDGDALPDACTYYALGGVCLAFHGGLWPGLIMVHMAALPSAWGRAEAPTLQILRQAAADLQAARIAGWVKQSNRLMCRFAERVGFEIDGRLPLAEPVMLYGWRP